MRFYFSIIFIISLILIIFITELYLKSIGLGDPVRYDTNYIYGYAPKINQKKQRLDGAKVSINDFGLRSIYDWNNNNKDKIIFIGDSITYGGSYIDDTKIFSHLVCETLKEYLCGNAGVNAYSIINMVMRSRYDKRLKEANKIVFLVAPGDFYREYANSDTAHFYLNNKQFFLPGITEALSFVSTKYDINKYISKKDDTKISKNEEDLADYSINILISEIKRLEKSNKDVYLFYTIEKNDKKSLNQNNSNILNKLAKTVTNKFYVLDEILNKDEFFFDNVHYSKKGHSTVAEFIISVLE